MVHDTVHYTKLTTDETASGRANEESDEEDEVTVYLKQPYDGRQRDVVKRDTWVRVTVALILLCIVMGFMLMESRGWWSNPDDLNEIAENPKDIEDDHQNAGVGDDDDHDHHDHEGHSHDHTNLYHHAVVLTSSANCSRVGRELLQDGGNLVDAALASLLCLGVVHPHTAGIGGAFSAVFYNHSSRTFKRISSSVPPIPLTSYGAPSILQGVKVLHSQWGQIEWSRLFQGAVELAQDGFLIDKILGRALGTHEAEVAESGLCALFCDAGGRVKSPGASAINRNLSELLRAASLNETHFPEKLAMKLAEDLSPREGPALADAVRRGSGEIDGSLIAEGEKYAVFSASSSFVGPILSDILERVREESLGFQSGGDLSGVAVAYFNLLNLTRELREAKEENPDFTELFGSNQQSNLIAVLDGQGNFIIMSATMNGTWGSGRFLSSSGIVLSAFTAEVSDAAFFNFPLVLKIADDEDEEKNVEVVAITGGLSAVFNAAVLLHNRIDLEMNSPAAISSPLLHLEPGSFTAETLCLSLISNGADVYRLFTERDAQPQEAERCSDSFQAVMLRLHAEHVGAYGAPAAVVHIEGY